MFDLILKTFVLSTINNVISLTVENVSMLN